MGLAAVPWDRRETYKAGGLGVLETPELGRLDDEHVAVASPTPGMLVKMLKRWHRSESALRSALRRRSIASIWRSVWRELGIGSSTYCLSRKP